MKFKAFKALVENEENIKIKCLRSDNGGEFTSNEFNEFCETHGIKRQYSATKMPQQNGVVERKNMTVQEAAITMLNEAKNPDGYWREAIYTTVYVQNRGHLKLNGDNTPYKPWFGRPASVKYFRVFGSKCFIKRDDDNLGKFDSITHEIIFLGYSSTKREYICYNLGLHKIIESENVIVDDSKPRRIQIPGSVDVEETDNEEIYTKKGEEISQEEDEE